MRSYLELARADRHHILPGNRKGRPLRFGRSKDEGGKHNKVGVCTYLFLLPCGTRNRGQEGLVITRMVVAGIGHDEKSFVGLWELKEWEGVVWGGGNKLRLCSS